MEVLPLGNRVLVERVEEKIEDSALVRPQSQKLVRVVKRSPGFVNQLGDVKDIPAWVEEGVVYTIRDPNLVLAEDVQGKTLFTVPFEMLSLRCDGIVLQ